MAVKVLDLFSGIGGFSLGLERAGFKTIAFCEIDQFCQRILKKHWPDIPIYTDIRNLTGERIGPVDVICGGFPCQPFSLAGQRRGTEDDRHLWPEMRRLIDELRPAWVIGENVAGIIGVALDGVLSDLESLGYATRTFVIPACAVDAPHRRDRVWIVANSDSIHDKCRQSKRQRICQAEIREISDHNVSGSSEDVAHRNSKQQYWSRFERTRWRNEFTDGCGTLAHSESEQIWPAGQSRECSNVEYTESIGWGKRRPESEIRSGWTTTSGASRWNDAEWIDCNDGAKRRVKPGVRLLATGIPGRVARLKALGNAVVPQVVERIGNAIMMAGNR